MGLSLYNIKKWYRMLTGNSILHVEQDIGKVYSVTEVKGYYNDLTNKVLKGKNKNEVTIPVFKAENGLEVMFPITIFQYGLGAYDLFLLYGDKLYYDKFMLCVDWALKNQQQDGSWNTFYFLKNKDNYSSMAQGEGASLLIRAYINSENIEYLEAAKSAINFMVTPVENGGTALYINDEVFLLEVTNRPVILNGWIFSLFGLYDYLLIDNNSEFRIIYERSVRTLVNHIVDFDNGFWTKYNNDKMIASEFYHKLHLAQVKVMYNITGNKVFLDYYKKWSKYYEKSTNRIRAFIVKAMQKIAE